MEDCIFCKITHKVTPTEVVYEDERFMVFPDIRPKAPVHLLVVPKKHIATLDDANEQDESLLGGLLLCASKVAKEKQLRGYKLAMNVGKEGGQEINHIHLHLLAQ